MKWRKFWSKFSVSLCDSGRKCDVSGDEYVGMIVIKASEIKM